jgi:peptide/nickel transport system ATP-binding protein
VLDIGTQIAENARRHLGLSRRASRDRAVEMLDLVRIPDPRRRLAEYPHQLSGGMRQRVMIAIALACNPKVLIADEPTTALDVTIQAQILQLLGDLKARLGMAMILITHDLGIVAEMCDRVVVMYAGRVAESAPVDELFARARHPYTCGLMRAVLRVDLAAEAAGRRPKLREIAGHVPALTRAIPGCSFAPRCKLAMDRCQVERPALTAIGDHRRVACHEWRRVPEAMM